MRGVVPYEQVDLASVVDDDLRTEDRLDVDGVVPHESNLRVEFGLVVGSDGVVNLLPELATAILPYCYIPTIIAKCGNEINEIDELLGISLLDLRKMYVNSPWAKYLFPNQEYG